MNYLLIINELNHFTEMSRPSQIVEIQLLFISFYCGSMSWLSYHKLNTMLWKLFLIQLSIHRIKFKLFGSESKCRYNVIPWSETFKNLTVLFHNFRISSWVQRSFTLLIISIGNSEIYCKSQIYSQSTLPISVKFVNRDICTFIHKNW